MYILFLSDSNGHLRNEVISQCGLYQDLRDTIWLDTENYNTTTVEFYLSKRTSVKNTADISKRAVLKNRTNRGQKDLNFQEVPELL